MILKCLPKINTVDKINKKELGENDPDASNNATFKIKNKDIKDIKNNNDIEVEA